MVAQSRPHLRSYRERMTYNQTLDVTLLVKSGWAWAFVRACGQLHPAWLAIGIGQITNEWN
jgi:hypothetical protein